MSVCINIYKAIYSSIYRAFYPSFDILNYYASDKHRFFYCIEADRHDVRPADKKKVCKVADAVKSHDFLEGLQAIVKVKNLNEFSSIERYRLKKKNRRKQNDAILANARKKLCIEEN
jgi:hypothetical protein